jgi:hypothetical protein
MPEGRCGAQRSGIKEEPEGRGTAAELSATAAGARRTVAPKQHAPTPITGTHTTK